MPLYEYQCPSCKKVLEVMQKFADAPLTECPECNGPVTKLMSLGSFALKGQGWYVTDYKRKGADSSSGSESGSKPASGGAAASAPSTSSPATQNSSGTASGSGTTGSPAASGAKTPGTNGAKTSGTSGTKN